MKILNREIYIGCGETEIMSISESVCYLQDFKSGSILYEIFKNSPDKLRHFIDIDNTEMIPLIKLFLD